MSVVASLTKPTSRGYSGSYQIVARVFFGSANRSTCTTLLGGWEHRLLRPTCTPRCTEFRSFSISSKHVCQLHKIPSCSVGYSTNFGKRRRHAKPLLCSLAHLRGAGGNYRYLGFQIVRTIARQKSDDSKAGQESGRVDKENQSMSDTDKDPSPSNDDGDITPPQHRDSQMTSILKQMRSIPNIITMSRIASTPFISYLILNEQYEYALTGCVVFGLTDWLDGYIAKNYEGQMTVLGTYLDPAADKIMINVLALSLCYNDILPGPIVALWLARDVGLVVTAYWSAALVTKRGDAVADPARTALKVEPTLISKFNTVVQFVTISTGMVQPVCDLSPDIVLGLCWITAGTTVASGLSYVGGASLTQSGNKRGESKGRKL